MQVLQICTAPSCFIFTVTLKSRKRCLSVLWQICRLRHIRIQGLHQYTSNAPTLPASMSIPVCSYRCRYPGKTAREPAQLMSVPLAPTASLMKFTITCTSLLLYFRYTAFTFVGQQVFGSFFNSFGQFSLHHSPCPLTASRNCASGFRGAVYKAHQHWHQSCSSCSNW